METEKLEEIKKKVTLGLYFSRVPKKTKAEFIVWAKEEFCDDRGMAFKHLWDFFKGCLPNQNQMLTEQIELMAQEIESLKSTKVEEPKKKVIKSVAGTKITERGE